MRPFILFITGPSASGKSTLFGSLRQDASLQHAVVFHDVDENGVPPVGRNPWRAFRAQELLYEAGQAFERGVSSIICGIVKPHEIVESKYFQPAMNVHFVVLDAPYEILETRLRERLASEPKVGTLDPIFNPDAVPKLLLSTRDLQRELKFTTAQQRNGHVLDAARLSKEQMHDAVLRIITEIRQPVA